MDVFIDEVADFTPFFDGCGERPLAGEADSAIESDPAHKARMKEFAPPSAYFPDAFVGTIPIFNEPVKDTLEVVPAVIGNSVAILAGEVYSIDELAVDIKLKLLVGAVANANRARARG